MIPSQLDSEAALLRNAKQRAETVTGGRNERLGGKESEGNHPTVYKSLSHTPSPFISTHFRDEENKAERFRHLRKGTTIRNSGNR
jgi:hypothetical protein